MGQTIQMIVDWAVVVMACLLVLFSLFLLFLHLLSNARQENMQRLREQVMRLVYSSEDEAYLKEDIYEAIHGEAVTLRGIRGIRSHRGVQVLELVSREVEGKSYNILQQAVSEAWYMDYLRSLLAGRKKEAALLAVKLAGELKLHELNDEVERVFNRWNQDTMVQEACLYTLFVEGELERLLRLFSWEKGITALSFRSLNELFAHYGGNPRTLFRVLLPSARDQYVRRACIRGIGERKCEEFGEELHEYLATENLNILIETIRSCGKLNYRPAMDTIRAMLAHEAWEVRCAVIDVLAECDRENSRNRLIYCLHDGVWWVRFHAAQAVAALPDRQQILEDVRRSGDTYAYEMLSYMLQRNRILEGGATP